MAELVLSRDDVDIDSRSRNKYRYSALMLAAQFGRTEIAQLLIKVGAGLELTDARGQTALEMAIASRQLDSASALIEQGASIDFRPQDSKLAVSFRQVTFKSITQGASFDFDIQDSAPEGSVLHAASIRDSNRPPIVKTLLARHERLRSKKVLNQFTITYGDGLGRTPLHRAVYYADVESVEALLNYGADPNAWAVPYPLTEPNPYCVLLQKQTPKDLLELLLRKAERNRLDPQQLKVARGGEPSQMRHIPFLSEQGKRLDRLQRENIEGTKQFDFRLEDIREEKQGQAGIRNFVARLREIKRLMEEKT